MVEMNRSNRVVFLWSTSQINDDNSLVAAFLSGLSVFHRSNPVQIQHQSSFTIHYYLQILLALFYLTYLDCLSFPRKIPDFNFNFYSLTDCTLTDHCLHVLP